MSITIGQYEFEGPYDNTDMLEDRSGIYAILCLRDGTNSESHAYAGAEWHRISTTANGTAVTYVYDGDNVVVDCVAGSDPEGPSYVASKYYVTPFLDQNVGMYVVSGETLTPYYYTQDGLGSVRTLSDASGALKVSVQPIRLGAGN